MSNGWPTPAVVGEKAPATPSRLPKINLKNIDQVKLELARLYRAARHGQLDTGEATKLAYILNMLAKLIETSEVEKRVERLEKLNSRKGNGVIDV